MPARKKYNVGLVKRRHLGRSNKRFSKRYPCSDCCRATNHSKCSVSSRVDDKRYRDEPVKSKYYRRIMWGLKKSNPAAIVLWVFHRIPSSKGLAARTIIRYLKIHHTRSNNSERVGKRIGAMLRTAVEFGLLQKRDNKYFLKRRVNPRS